MTSATTPIPIPFYATRLLPLLVAYFAFVLLRAQDTPQEDEARYLTYARNLIHGLYASEDAFLWSGPGYPLVLMPFVFAGVSLIWAKLLNAVLLFVAIVYYSATLTSYVAPGWVLASSFALGLYLLLHGSQAEALLSEPLAVALLSGALFHYCRACQANARRLAKHLGLAGMLLGALALTKVFFGYVIMSSLLLSTGLVFVGRLRRMARLSIVVCTIALIFCVPYLFYTHWLTGRVFYWSNAGGLQLYSLTVPNENSYGGWLSVGAVLSHPEEFPAESALFRALMTLPHLERDGELKRLAIQNICRQPGTYVRNWRANVNRMVFGYPLVRYGGGGDGIRTGNRSFVYSAIFIALAASVYPAIVGRRRIPVEIWIVVTFALISLAGLSLLSAFPRLIFPLLPILALWVSVTWSRVVSVRLHR